VEYTGHSKVLQATGQCPDLMYQASILNKINKEETVYRTPHSCLELAQRRELNCVSDGFLPMHVNFLEVDMLRQKSRLEHFFG
jgi:hypothetical protein